jgi:hypothetical protein
MDARMSLIAGALVATAALPLTASAADTPAASPVPGIVAAATAASTAPQGCPGDTGVTRRSSGACWPGTTRGANVLLGYVWITRNIHLLDRYATLEWAGGVSQDAPVPAEAPCAGAGASTSPWPSCWRRASRS